MQGLERLHYFDGQRLAAKDFELEQNYHMRVRRMLNRGLYSPGIVSGLQVTKVDARHVRVSTGIALDPGGKEVIVLSDTIIASPNRRPASALPGYFLTIRYDEESDPGTMAECRNGSGTTPPSRTREAPLLSWTETWPNQQSCGVKGHPEDCAVVLALVVLDSACLITAVDAGVRQYSRSQVPRQVHPMALEGEKDIDSSNPKKLNFQILGGPPSGVVLYLWADAISSLLYTEVGAHTHALTKAHTQILAKIPDHVHKLGGKESGAADPATHSHKVSVLNNSIDDLGQTGQIVNVPLSSFPAATYRTGIPPYLEEDGGHRHALQGDTGLPALSPAGNHSHGLTGLTDSSGNTAPTAGSTPNAARGGPAYSFPDGVRVKLDGTDITGLIESHLSWSKLGDGTATHALATKGTGAVDLLQLGLAVAVGSHQLEFRVPKGGGKILYNLYVQ
jgi:hypothetical protein